MIIIRETICFQDSEKEYNENFFWNDLLPYCPHDCVESIERCFGFSFCFGVLDDGRLVFEEDLEKHPEFDGMVDFGAPIRDEDGKLHKKTSFKVEETQKERRYYFNGRLKHTEDIENW